MKTFTVTGMTCSACSAHVEKAVRSLPGVSNVAVSLLTNQITVDFATPTTQESVIQAVIDAGYGAAIADPENLSAGLEDTETPRLKRRLIQSICFLVPLMYVTMGHMVGLPLPGYLERVEGSLAFALIQLILTAPIVWINRAFFISGFRGLFHKSPGMDALVCLGAGAAVIYGLFAMVQIAMGLQSGDLALVHQYRHDLYFESAAMILTLITVGKFLEAYSKGKTTNALKGLMKLAPQTATLLVDGIEREAPIAQVKEGDIFLVRPGESIPVDGLVLEGNSTVNEAALTGESMPVDKAPGDGVSTATINQNGALTCKATRVGQDTTLSQVIRLVQEAASTKAPLAKTADKVSGVFVPLVMILAIITLVLWLALGETVTFALSRAISVLVISCPCALGLATPVAIMAGSGMGAKHGILFKSAASLELAGRVGAVVLDKTGTITQGEPHVTRVLPAKGVTETELLSSAAALEVQSEHPLARAILDHVQEKEIAFSPAQDLKAIPGKGIAGTLDGRPATAGNAAYLQEFLSQSPDLAKAGQDMAQQGMTPLYFAKEGHLLGVIGVADVIKENSAQAVAQLKGLGIQVVMLTGDNALTAAHIASQAGLTKHEVIADVLPDEKEAVAHRLQAAGRVAMVGDGINDAPALTRADVGIAIGAGADIAIDAADVVLVKSDLLQVPAAIRLSRRVIRNIHQNLFWAFFYNVVCIPLAAGVYASIGLVLNPMWAAGAMSLSSVCVVLNALRLNWVRVYDPARDRPIHDVRQQEAFRSLITNQIPANAIPPYPPSTQIKEEHTMEKTIRIEGMMCQHCQNRIQKALEAIPGVKAQVDYQAGTAKITATEEVSEDALKKVVEDQDYKVTGIQ